MFTVKKITLALLWILFLTLEVYSTDRLKFQIKEVPVYRIPDQTFSQVLKMDYASYVIQNFDEWENSDNRKEVFQVDIIFTKYPFDKKDWITHYDSLLHNRIQSISHLEPSVLNPEVTWNLILQTQCSKESEAKKLFHGAIIWYKEEPVVEIFTSKKSEEVIASQNIVELMNGHYKFPDSTVYKTLDRNYHWQNMLIINDWTASMYQYGSQAVLWHQAQLDKGFNKVSRFAFFNDGDHLKKIAKSKGIYFAKPDNINQILRLMQKVQKNGNGGDTPEKYMEALLTSIDKTKSYNELILIADNKSPVKDIKRLKELHIPVRIIICGLKKGQAIRHDYLQIASYTSGSIHTIEEDVYNLSEIKEGQRLQIMDIEYQRTHGRIVKAKQKTVKTQL
jgi:hypothetical protein